MRTSMLTTRRWPPHLRGCLTAGLLLAAAAGGADLRGKVEILKKGGTRPCRTCDLTEAVVYFEPTAETSAPAPSSFEIRTTDKQFEPKVRIVPRGSSVSFPNDDPILHNVFSVSKGNAFDLGLYRGDTVKSAKFDTPGVVRVFCNVHPTMAAYVLVLETSYVASPEPDGSFVIPDVPAGEGRLTVWHDRADARSVTVQVPSAKPVEVSIEADRARVPAHLNKFGKPYARSRGDKYDR